MTARWSDPQRLMALAVALAAIAAVVGLYASFYLNVASGPAIVLIETAFFLVALVLGPRTGLLSRRPSIGVDELVPG